MKKNTPISSIMQTHVVTLQFDDKLETAEKLFKKHKIRHLPVMKKDKIVGMLSYSDLLRISFADISNDEHGIDSYVYDVFTIEQIMAKNLYMVHPHATIKDVAAMLAEKDFHALPVVEDNELVGIVTTTDLNRFLVDQL